MDLKKVNYRNCISESVRAMGSWMDEEFFDYIDPHRWDKSDDDDNTNTNGNGK